MMKNIKLLFLPLIASLILISCGSDDDTPRVEVRDPQEVYLEDIAKINEFLNTHYYDESQMQNAAAGADFEVIFKEIEAGNSSQIPLSQKVTSQIIKRSGIDYQVYILKAREGSGTGQATFADSTLVSYEGTLLNGNTFDSSINSIWFDLPSTITGFSAGITQFKDAQSITPNGDGTLSYSGSGIGAVFIPSGLGYFNSSQTGIPAYSPLIFTFKLRKAKSNDHDGDGILSKFEDLNGDGNLRSANFADDTDRDGRFNYLEVDDDNDGILTKNENADPNGDGNPSDAKDTDGDGIPDYLDARTEN
jgi:FKBP-type peptidyl-prolyl cis-trans isomerase